MSLITSCPACGTMFRVVPDQLKISEGWVRCGHCAEVFDATAHLGDQAAAGTGAMDTLPGELLPQPATAEEAFTGWESTAAASLPPPVPVPVPPPQPLEPAPSPPPAGSSRFGPDSQALESSDLDAPFVFRRSDFVEPDPMPSVLPPVPGPGDSRFEPDEDAEPELAGVSFVRQARRKAWWRRPLVRLVLTVFSLALAALLALQLAYHDRDRLAAAQPQLRPLLAQMCAWLQCTLGPPRQIDAIAIESSGFNRLRGDNYRLTFNVRNTSPLGVAVPALELTLTDAQDQPLLRRVLSPTELGATQGAIPAGSEWAGSLGVVVDSGNANRVAGYRLLAFYP